jgi:hypothetical protein
MIRKVDAVITETLHLSDFGLGCCLMRCWSYVGIFLATTKGIFVSKEMRQWILLLAEHMECNLNGTISAVTSNLSLISAFTMRMCD